MPKITKNFSVEEFCHSDKAIELQIRNQITDPAIRDNMFEFVESILQPLRDAWGSGIRITSGYRNPALNKAIGGSATSSHMLGCAADLLPSNGNIDAFFQFTEDWLQANDIAFDQCIRERNVRGSRWLHLGMKNRNGLQRRQFLNLLQR